MGQESAINIQIVHGGFILSTYDPESGAGKTEVFTSQSKLMKALRAGIEANSLVGKSKDEVTGDAQ